MGHLIYKSPMHAKGFGILGKCCASYNQGGEALLRQAMQRLDLSARAYHRVLRVARTLADLAGAARPGAAHVAEAIQYRRSLDAR
jgi:predicted ATPase with chaperone activity